MGHLRKKIHNLLEEDNIRIWSEFIPIINKSCLMFYEYEKGKRKVLFYYLYDKTKNLNYNLNKIKEYVERYTDYVKIANCKKGFNYLKENEFKECQRKCFYSIYCKRKVNQMKLETINKLMEAEEKMTEEIMDRVNNMEYYEIINCIKDCPLLEDCEIEMYTKSEQKEMKQLMQSALMELLKAVDFRQQCNFKHLLKIYKKEGKNKNDNI